MSVTTRNHDTFYMSLQLLCNQICQNASEITGSNTLVFRKSPEITCVPRKSLGVLIRKSSEFFGSTRILQKLLEINGSHGNFSAITGSRAAIPRMPLEITGALSNYRITGLLRKSPDIVGIHSKILEVTINYSVLTGNHVHSRGIHWYYYEKHRNSFRNHRKPAKVT